MPNKPFTAGDIVVVRVGDGSTALSSTSVPVFLDEYNSAGALVQSIALPTTGSGANHALTDAGSATSEGILNLSGDGHYLLLAGFDAPVGTATVAASAVTTGRVIARVGADGIVDTTTSLTLGGVSDVRSVASADGSSFYLGTNTNAYYATLGGTTPAPLGPLNSRDLELYGTQLYDDTAGSVGKFGTSGPPMSGTQTVSGLMFETAPGSSLGDFVLEDLDGTPGYDTLYIVDGTNGLEKYSLVGASWVLNSKITMVGTTAITGLEGLTATVTGTTVSLYVSSPTRILSLTDTKGYNAASSATTLTSVVDHTSTTAYPNQAIRGISFAPTAAAVTPAVPTLSINNPSVAEGDTGTTTLTYTVTASAASTSAITFQYATADGTATAGSDYITTSGTGTIAAGATTTTFTVTVNGDRVIEPNETVLVNLTAPTNATIATPQGTGTIVNDDFAGTFTLTGNVSQAEASGAQVFTVNRAGSVGAVTVDYTITGSGTHPADATDFGGTLPHGTVTFADGVTSATISVPVSDDHTVEPDETYTVTLSNATGGASVGTAATATGTIVNDDVAGTFALAGNVSANEAAGSQSFVVNRTGGTAGSVTINYAVTGSGAHPADANDFGGTLPSGTVTFLDGETSHTIVVPVTDDTTFEPDETYTLTLSSPTQGTLGAATATGTIINDDPVPPVGAFSLAADVSQNEGAGAEVFTINRTGGSAGSVTVDYAVTGSGTSPADANDFTGGTLPHGTVTFADGVTSMTISVPVSDDHFVEPNETFTLTLSNATGGSSIGTATATGTIVNDDVAGAFALAGDVSQSEAAGSQTFTVNRTGGTAGPVTINYAVTGSGAHPADATDFGGTLPSGTVTFADGETSHTIVVPVTDDTTYEPDETYTLTLSSPTQGTLGAATATGTITNDDPVPPTLSVSDASVLEGDNGTTTLTFTVTSSAAAPAGGISFGIATADGTATAGSDYVAQSTTGTIAAGATTTTFSVVVNGDTVYERNETMTVNLSNPTNATIAHGQGVGTIENDDPVPATMQIFSTDFGSFTAAGFSPGATAASGKLDSNIWRVVGLSDNTNPSYGFTGPAAGDFGRGIITGNADPVTAGVYSPSADHAIVIQPTGAELDANGTIEARIQNTSGATATSFDVAFDWAYRNSGGRADNLQLQYSTDGTNYTAATGANFTTPGAADAPIASTFADQHETLSINGTVADGGYLYLRWVHTSSSGGGNRDEVGIDNVTVTAHLSSTPSASVGDISVTEGNSGTTNATFTISRSSGTSTASVDYATHDGTATAGSDYVAQHGTVNFAVGQLTQTVTVLVNGDTANEANETFTLNLSNPVGFVVPQPVGTATIQNDDTGPVAIYDIQGSGQSSPFAGQSVMTTGVVTQVVAHGFYMQDPTGDGNIATSDGIYVFLGATATPTVSIGNAVSVTGTVTEYVGGTDNLSITEINSPTVTVTATVGATITPVLISADGDGRAPPTTYVDDDRLTSYDPTTDGIDFYESLEGMLVTIKNPLVVANTSAGNTFVVASDGVGATGLNSRDGLTLEAADQQPEKIKIYDTTETHAQGEQLNSVTGILTYYAGEYEVDPIAKVTTMSAGNSVADTARETTSLVGDASHLSYASFNLENLSPVPDNNGNDTQAKIDARFATHANEIVNALHSPDVIGVQEIQDNDGDLGTTALSGAQTAQKLIDAIAAAGGPTYKYIEIAPTANGISGGDPNGNIRDGFLYNPARVSYVDGSAHRLDNSTFAGTRYPLVADFTFNGQTFTAIDTHSTSRGGSDPVYASVQPPTQAGDSSRTAQSDAIQQYIIAQEQNDPTHTFIVNGDFNGYYYERALTDLVTGTNLTNLYDKLAPAERYSYYFDGTYEAFDNILVSTSRSADSSFDVVHYNAGYTDGLSTTDHDQVIATIGFARSTGTATAIADNYATTAAAILHGTVVANDTGGGTTLSVTAINGSAAQIGVVDHLASGATITLMADGSFAYDTDGAFGGLSASMTATDSFTYTLAGGSTATATITVTGVTTPAPDSSGHIQGTSGNDTYSGTANGDYFDLSTGGNDTVDGGAGNDAFFLGGALTAADHINGGSGDIDEVGLQGDYNGANALVLNATTLTNIELLAVLPGGSTLHSYDITSNDAMVAAGQVFTVFGGNLAAGENFTFNGSAETDGSFLFFGGNGTDTLTGGAGNDAFFFGPDKFGSSDVVHGGLGMDELGLDGHSAALTLDAAHTDVELVALLNGSPQYAPDVYGKITVADSWVAAGQTKTITGVTQFQSSVGPVSTSLVIDGSQETDGNLNIYGGTANDTLTGGAGADHLYGGLGADTLTGGAGADVFLYNSPTESTGQTFDTLVDFTIGSDTLKIDGQGADSYTNVSGGRLSTATFEADLQAAVGSQLSTGHAVFFTATSGDYANQTFLLIDANGSAGYQSGGDYVIHVPAAPVPTQGAADFITH